jgi:phosphate transport system ATP-binding protein
MESKLLDVKALSAWFGTNQAVKEVSINFDANTVTAIIGPSGCGKSTFIRCLNRLHEEVPGASAAGHVILKELDIWHGVPKGQSVSRFFNF